MQASEKKEEHRSNAKPVDIIPQAPRDLPSETLISFIRINDTLKRVWKVTKH